MGLFRLRELHSLPYYLFLELLTDLDLTIRAHLFNYYTSSSLLSSADESLSELASFSSIIPSYFLSCSSWAIELIISIYLMVGAFMGGWDKEISLLEMYPLKLFRLFLLYNFFFL